MTDFPATSLTAPWTLAEWPRPESGPAFDGRLEGLDLSLSGLPGWSSHGGPGRSHPARANPTLIEIPFDETAGNLEALALVGIFARWAGAKLESPGTLGASVQFGEGDTAHIELINGRHYRDSLDLTSRQMSSGDGTVLRKIGEIELDGERHRVDLLWIEVPLDAPAPSRVRFRDLGSPASFILFDVAFQLRAPAGCPFHSGHGGIALSEIGAIIRLRDRNRFRKALVQLEASIAQTEDLDEARGEALTFTAVVAAATLELGAPRSMHRLQLEAARRLERANSPELIFSEAQYVVDQAVGWLFDQPETPNSRLVERAVSIVDRQFARPLTDAQVASQLGLSPSHFRFLFRQATGQPFHKYLVSVRLEKARKLLAEQGLPVSEVATAVGFSGLSHFSRAFSQRFNESPNQVRNAGR